MKPPGGSECIVGVRSTLTFVVRQLAISKKPIALILSAAAVMLAAFRIENLDRRIPGIKLSAKSGEGAGERQVAVPAASTAPVALHFIIFVAAMRLSLSDRRFSHKRPEVGGVC